MKSPRNLLSGRMPVLTVTATLLAAAAAVLALAADYPKGEVPTLDRVMLGAYVGVVNNQVLVPLSARVSGAKGPLAGVPVVFAVEQGKSSFATEAETKNGAAPSVTVQADEDGQAVAWLYLPVDFSAVNRLSITAGATPYSAQAQVAVMLDDYSGTGTLQISTNRIPAPYLVAPRLQLLNPERAKSQSLTFARQASFVSGQFFLSQELFLEPTDFIDEATHLTLHNTTGDALYQLVWKLDFNTETHWHPAQIITGNGGNVDLDPFPAYGQQKMFFAVTTNSGTTVRIEFAEDSPTDAIEPDSLQSDPGQEVRLNIIREGPTNAALTVYFGLTGSATFEADYLLTNSSGLLVTNSIVIPAGTNSAELTVTPLEDQLPEFDESVVVLLLSDGRYFVDPTNGVAALVISNNPPVNFLEQVTVLPQPVGIDYHPGIDSLIVSVYAGNELANNALNFYRIGLDGTDLLVTNWSEIAGITAEPKLAIVKTTGNGFTAGEMFFGTGVEGAVGKLSADGTVSNLNWTQLDTNVSNPTLLRGGLYVDETGLFTNRLLIVTGGSPSEGGEVWQSGADANGNATNTLLLASFTNEFNPHLEGVISLPNNALSLGPWAGKIITGAESGLPPRINTIDVNGVATTDYLGIGPEDFDLVVTDQHLYCAIAEVEAPYGIYKISKTNFNAYVGDLLITQEAFGPLWQKLFLVHWDSTNFLHYKTIIPIPYNVEHVTFAPINLPTQ